LRVEECLLPRISPRLLLRVPLFTHVARDDAGRPAFAGYESIRGAAAQRPPPEQTAGFLQVLHHFPVDVAAGCGVRRAEDTGVDGRIAMLLEPNERYRIPAVAARLSGHAMRRGAHARRSQHRSHLGRRRPAHRRDRLVRRVRR
jgi:hypothetical protein